MGRLMIGMGCGGMRDQRSELVAEIHARWGGIVCTVLAKRIREQLRHVELSVDAKVIGGTWGISVGGSRRR